MLLQCVQVAVTAMLWGFGTAIGEVPPYFLSYQAAVAGTKNEALMEVEDHLHAGELPAAACGLPCAWGATGCCHIHAPLSRDQASVWLASHTRGLLHAGRDAGVVAQVVSSMQNWMMQVRNAAARVFLIQASAWRAAVCPFG